MLAESEQSLKIIYYVCVGQFVTALIWFGFISKPIDQSDMLLIGLSGAMGLLYSGIERRDFEEFKKEKKKEADQEDLDSALNKIKNEQN